MNRLQELRVKKGLSQLELSKVSGVDQSAISKVELRKNKMSEDTIIKICRALEVSADELLGMVVRDKEKPME